MDNSGNFNCFYQLVDGEYYFSISAQFDSFIKGIGIGSQNITIQETETYPLIEIGQNNFSADIFIDTENNFETDSNTPGNITISRLNLNSNVVSAKFEFTATDPDTGTVYEITEGRFDAQFTQ